mgnify:CR=1 FL=1
MIEKIRTFLQVKDRDMGLNDSIIFFCGMLVGWFILVVFYLLMMLI